MQRRLVTVLATGAMLFALATPAAADPQGYIQDDFGVGYFYGTFGQSPNIVLLAGGTVEQFCEASPDDPFNGEPGLAPLRLFLRQDGSVDLKVNDTDQPVNLYYSDIGEGPVWAEQVCSDYFADGVAPSPFASGTANLKVRISVISENLIDVFNSVNGEATGTDGRQYRVRASADLIVEDGMPVGDPEDFVSFELTEIRR